MLLKVKKEEIKLSKSVKIFNNKIDVILKQEIRALKVLIEIPKKAVVATAKLNSV